MDIGSDDLIIIDLEVFFGVSERDGLHEAAAWLTRNGIGWSGAMPPPRLPRPQRLHQRARQLGDITQIITA